VVTAPQRPSWLGRPQCPTPLRARTAGDTPRCRGRRSCRFRCNNLAEAVRKTPGREGYRQRHEPNTGCRCRGAWHGSGSGPRRRAEPPIEVWAVSHTKGTRLSPEASGTLAGGPVRHLRGHVAWHLRRPLCPLEPRRSCRPRWPSCRGTTVAPPAASLHHQPALRAATSHHPGRPTSSPRRYPGREAQHSDCSCAGRPTPASATPPGSSTTPRRPHGALPDRR